MSTSAELQVMDRETALARVGGDLDLLRELAGLFQQEYPNMLGQIHVAIANGEAHEVERNAHGLKGSAANFGAAEVVDLSRRLEFLSRDRKVSEFPVALAALEAALERLDQALAAL